jgi:hypothetical protein
VFECGDDVGSAVGTRHDQDGDVALVADVSAEFEVVLWDGVEVEDDQLGRVGVHDVERVVGVIGGAGADAVGAESELEQLSGVRVGAYD